MNQRERLTKLLLKQSLIRLLQDKEISQISVKELCTSAGINRSTFYLHYANAYELLDNVEQEIIDNTNEYLIKIEASESAVTYILAFLDYIKRNEELFTVMLFKTNDDVFFPKRLLNEILMSIDNHLQLKIPEDMKPFTYAYLVNGSLAIIKEWIRTKFTVSSHELAQLICALNDHALMAFKASDKK
ncbi:TetR family transcriptional regulator [Paenibacillus sp. FSL R7-277]|uniref:TetR/AcrR family transcriptional regulator n=1 Tax=unclassified Paenibacillus TaxID=185978 RepID=UPI0003E28824|nr:TetR-like C-terminal domain-containing protein [Paenibacillus sp. FSL R7-277]ETT73285.1 TetR family transcriptional regulator [Paenibacillus sp. FSL R7-277]